MHVRSHADTSTSDRPAGHIASTLYHFRMSRLIDPGIPERNKTVEIIKVQRLAGKRARDDAVRREVVVDVGAFLPCNLPVGSIIYACRYDALKRLSMTPKLGSG